MESSAPVPSSSSTVSRTSLLVLRGQALVFLVISLILISVDKATEVFANDGVKIKFNDLQSYRYMLAAIIIGFAYNLFQMALLISNVVSGKRLISGDFGYHLDFFGDKITAYLLATGAAAGFGASEDVQRAFTELLLVPIDAFFNMANASAALLFVAFLFTATASVFASFALPTKKADQRLVEDNA
ncbi:CASP-like protein 4D1 [Prosopis cineraria]|uniref:CASP-like protein 4D1 n=1 Tax=Prosopis cineraria TaxID=364024 RepID=UPI0024102184|nr:CASP-like protein 4D1 [Prosopis cineraria]